MKQQIKYNIGLDFGTYQSKVCVLRISDNPQKHEFIQFSDNKGELSYFLPSQIQWLENKKFTYGYNKNEQTKAEFNYFKIASAEDKEFRIVSGIDEDENVYQKEANFSPFTPEFLSVLYIANVLFVVKNRYKKENKNKLQGGGALIQKYNLLPQTDDIELIFSTQLGIPTEYSYKVNIIRRRKFETILLLASKLQNELRTIDNFLFKTSDELIEIVKRLLVEIKTDAQKIQFEELLNKNRLSVFPETAAGLTFLVHKKKVPPGFYSALDIGAGSSDLSFFRINDDYTISYLAAEAFMIAANNVSIEYLKLQKEFTDFNNKEIKRVEKIIKSIKEYNQDKIYHDSVKIAFGQLYDKIYNVFFVRVFPKFRNYNAYKEFKNQPCFVYGGGSKLPIQPYFHSILLSDQGNRGTIDDRFLTYATRRSISEYIPLENIIPQDETWKNDFEMLVTAFGLSFEHKGENAEYFWNINDYQEATKEERQLVAHPVNEDMFIYNVLLKEFETPITYKKEDEAVFLNSFSIQNFQGIKYISKIVIEENTKWIVLTGENGFGKTSLLRALVVGLFGGKDNKYILAENESEIEVEYTTKSGKTKNSVKGQNFERGLKFTQFAAYGTSRLSKDGDDEKKMQTYNIFNHDGICLDIEDELIKWEKDENQNKYFINVKKVLEQLLQPYIKEIYIDRNGLQSAVKYVEFDKIKDKNSDLTFSKLAAGFQTIVALAGDIILRLSQNKPENIYDLHGIVIIDEFDLHLHPKWQREMIERFSNVFPNIQFIISTHSPIPLLGMKELPTLIRVNRSENEGITAEILDIDYSDLLPNAILTSPIFNFQDLIPESHTNDTFIETDNDYSKIENNKKIEKEISEYLTEERTREILKLINPDKQ